MSQHSVILLTMLWMIMFGLCKGTVVEYPWFMVPEQGHPLTVFKTLKI